jgi:hypothetical protein
MSKLLNEELRKALPKLREQEGSADPVVFAKFFFPAGCWTWFVTEGQPEGDDFTFFGYVIGFEAEFGYFTLKELEEVKVKGIVIERDCYFEPSKLSACLSDLNLQ